MKKSRSQSGYAYYAATSRSAKYARLRKSLAEFYIICIEIYGRTLNKIPVTWKLRKIEQGKKEEKKNIHLFRLAYLAIS